MKRIKVYSMNCIYYILNKCKSKKNYEKYNSIEKYEKEEICGICFEVVSVTDSIELSGCRHKIHVTCVGKWIDNSECYLCKKGVTIL